jgi:hypothetical protein
MPTNSKKDVNSLTRRHNRKVIERITGEVKYRGWARGGCRGWVLHPSYLWPYACRKFLQNPPTQTWRTRLIVRIQSRPTETLSAVSHVDGKRASPPRRKSPDDVAASASWSHYGLGDEKDDDGMECTVINRFRSLLVSCGTFHTTAAAFGRAITTPVSCGTTCSSDSVI